MSSKVLIAFSSLLVLVTSAPAQTGAGAFWRSLLLPGWGQHYASGGGGRFLAAEGALWLSYAALNRLADVRADRFHAYAAERAGAYSRGKGRRFLDDLGFYESRVQHNQFALREDGPNAQLYPAVVAFDWEWDSDAARERYRGMRNDSQLAKRQALYATGLVVANHLLSAIHAARSVGKKPGATAAVHAQLVPQPDGVRWALVRRF